MKAVVPNLLTLSRVCLMPMSLYWFAEGAKELAFITYIFIALTDYWDGFFARRWKVTSSLGVILDQVCDKLVGLGFFMGLMFLGLCPVWFGGLISSITLLLTLGYFFLHVFHFSSGPQPSLRIGKWSTALQYLWIGWILLENVFLKNPLQNNVIEILHFSGFLGLGLLQIWVFFQYVLRMIHLRRPSGFSLSERS